MTLGEAQTDYVVLTDHILRCYGWFPTDCSLNMMSALQKDIIRQNYPHLNDELVIDEEFLNLFVPSRVLTDENINKILVRIFNEVKS